MSEPLLVKVGGSLRGAETLLDELASYPGPLVLVHGGGPEIGAWLTRLGLESRFEGGLRVTPPEHMEVVEVEVGLLLDLLEKGYTPLLAPIALDEEGPLNVNADTAASAVAGALGWPALFLTDVPGVLRNPKDPTTRFPHLTPKEVDDLKAQGILQGGMIPKVEAALNALRAGAPWAAIAQGERGVVAGVLQGERGTRFTL
ncbi:acetylaminoadipate kinase [Thermus scotoductus]|uniref:acetylglutamate kinase n=1 Tax=Thermus scotoductus TaxID=37636 RepID=A0A430RP83_THESC|nr:acetylglutamate kinase [Thermus scotoductus]RTH20743.1 acetylaminoadipate kinase [Thermus scotoductus]